MAETIFALIITVGALLGTLSGVLFSSQIVEKKLKQGFPVSHTRQFIVIRPRANAKAMKTNAEDDLEVAGRVGENSILL